MKTYTVAQLARLAGVSVRALHHYDEIGLLKPAQIGQNRYRFYGPEDLLRLQQILIHRELNIPLRDIGPILDAPDFNRLETLEQQREKLVAEAERYAQLVRTIDRTIENLKGDRAMDDAHLYKGVSAEKQAQFEQWLVDRYGPGARERVAQGKKTYAAMTTAEKDDAMAELAAIEKGLSDAMRQGISPQSSELDPLHARQRDWIAMMWGRSCPPEAFAGLADLHLGHPAFVSRYEAIAEGFSEWHAAAMKAWAARQAG